MAAEAATRSEADTALSANVATLSSAVSTENTRATAAEALKANLAGGNIFTTGKQVLAGSATGYASLNVPNGASSPSAPGPGDLWLLGSDIHLQFQDKNSATQSLAFLTDLQTADSTTLASAKSYTDTSVAAEATARTAADTSTLSSANSYTDTTAATTLSSAKSYTDSSAATTLGASKSYTDTSVAAEAAARIAGDATLTTSVAALDTAVARKPRGRPRRRALKANLAGGNNFTGGSQKLAAATGNYSSLNIASGGAGQRHVAAGDVALTMPTVTRSFRMPTTRRRAWRL